jgi:hypothetical protein
MKMGNILSPWRYEATARDARQSADLRPAAILHDAGDVAAFPDPG